MWKSLIFISTVLICGTSSDFFGNILCGIFHHAKTCATTSVKYNNITLLFDPKKVMELPQYDDRKYSLTFNRYMRYNEIAQYLLYIKARYGHIADVVSIGKSSEGREIMAVYINTNINIEPFREPRPVIMVDAGIHAREWISPATALFLIHQLVEHSYKNWNLISDVDWYIIPLVNPDGYEYSLKVDPMWRKTRRKYKNINKNTTCFGADLNRNFDIDWMHSGSSNDSCSETYAGPHPFSEPESRALRNLGIRLGNKLKMYITIHSFGPMLLHPYGYDKIIPYNARELQMVARTALRESKFKYKLGTAAQILYPSSGGSDDFFMAKLKVPLAYTIELPPGGSRGFNLEPQRINSVAEDSYGIIKNLAAYIVSKEKNYKMFRYYFKNNIC